MPSLEDQLFDVEVALTRARTFWLVDQINILTARRDSLKAQIKARGPKG